MMSVFLFRILKPFGVCWLVIGLSVSMVALAMGREDKSLKVSEEYRIGVMVKAVAAAIQFPEKPNSLEVVAQAGTDSRYYVMIRGWLKQELSSAQSLLEVARDAQQKSKLELKVEFLKKAIRRIDLE